MLIQRLIAIFLSMLAMLALGLSIAAAPVAAQSPASYRGQLNQLTLDMRAMWGELERFDVKPRYCLLPGEPSKAEDQALLDAMEARANALNARYNATKQGLKDFLKNNTKIAGGLMNNGVDPSDDRWWTRYNTSRDMMMNELRAKKAALAKAPEVDCSPKPKPKPVVAVTPAPPLPVRPVIEPIVWPTLPSHFCTEAERWKYLVEQINPLYLRQAENAEKAAKFRTQVEIQVNNRVQSDQPIPPALAALRRQAIADVAAQDREAKKSEGIYNRVKNVIPVIDCSKPAQTEPPRTAPPQTDPPATDARTGRVPSGIGASERERVARQQAIIDDVEEAITELQQLRNAGNCDKTWAAADDLDDWLEELSGPAVSITGRQRPTVPPAKIKEWDRRLDAIMKDCPRTRVGQRIAIPLEGSVEWGILNLHNKERAEVGAAPLRWDPEIAAAASAYAVKLAAGGPFVHSPRTGRENQRENLSRGLPGASAERMMINWIEEKKNFLPGTYPNVSKTGNWSDVSHYTQMIWPTTTHVGCGTARGAGQDVLVCRYSPPGNRDGSPALAQDAKVDGKPPTLGGGMIQIDPPAPSPPPPPPPPLPTAADEAPGGVEMQHPLAAYFTRAMSAHDKAVRECDQAGIDKAEAEMRYAVEELNKRRKAAKAAGRLSGVNPDDVKAVLKTLENWLRAAEELRRKAGCQPH